MSRCVDETNYVQPFYSQLMEARGHRGYHFNPITSWNIKRNGDVFLKPEGVS